MPRAEKWVVYILRSTVSRRTYVGATNNFSRRLRQHNGEIKGGAKATRCGRPWEPVVIVSGFHSNVYALQFEWAVKHTTKRKGRRFCSSQGVKGRIVNLRRIMNLERVTKGAPLTAEASLHFDWHDISVKQLYDKKSS